jgi:Uma2 family endonuclease
MGPVAPTQPLSAAEYLVWERAQLDKHEYHAGKILATVRTSPRHNFLSAAMLAELHAALRGQGCHVFSPSQQISASHAERLLYADAVVVCGPIELEPGTTDVLANPKVIVEVLSKSTEAYDRGDKWDAYQRLPSLTDYLLVSQAAARIEHFQRSAGGSWQYRLIEAGQVVTLSNGATLAIDAVYEGAFELAAG